MRNLELSSSTSSSSPFSPILMSSSFGPKTPSSWIWIMPCWFTYLLLGAIHEVSHLAMAWYLVITKTEATSSSEKLLWKFYDEKWWVLLYQVVIGRCVEIPMAVFDGSDGDDKDYYYKEMIRHAGWMVSVGIAFVLTLYTWWIQRRGRHGQQDDATMKNQRTQKEYRDYMSMVTTIAWWTACEAILTDLFQQVPTLPLATTTNTPTSATSWMFYCGNFGVILLHHLWLEDRAKHALDCLEQMVHVTMMRGAQSGGVVTFQPRKNNGNNNSVGNELHGIRSRVVNKKRTDLSKEIRKRIPVPAMNLIPQDFCVTWSGHTRFATTSIAGFDGTHPHQWTPPSKHKVYRMSTASSTTVGSKKYQQQQQQQAPMMMMVPSFVSVENYITHNGDFEFYTVNGKTYDLEIIQKWLTVVTGSPMPASVDSCAIAGMIDLLRCQGCFGLSARYAICLGLSTSHMSDSMQASDFPTRNHFDSIGNVFEKVFLQILQNNNNMNNKDNDESVETDATTTTSLSSLCEDLNSRHDFANQVVHEFESSSSLMELMRPLKIYITLTTGDDDGVEGGANLYAFCLATINAFFDNDLFLSTQLFMKHAKGSFGLCVTSSLDAHRQILLAARGQTISVAFFPDKGLICYGSEQAAVKAGMNTMFPGQGKVNFGDDVDSTRLDLDDLGGEIVVLDWGRNKYNTPPISTPNRHLTVHSLMNGTVQVILHQESKSASYNMHDLQLYHRMTLLSRNELIKPLQEPSLDPVLTDIQDIPKVCRAIQDDWRSKKGHTSLNRLTAFNLSCALRSRLEARIEGTIPFEAVDILLTGCEVSLWLAEQFASDIQKAFPKLRIAAISSNKILGLLGQEIAVPALGFPFNLSSGFLHDSIVIIVSHSGGTFAPLACSNLLQSATKNMFVVTSEWDTQIGKQLRAMDEMQDGEEHVLNQRIFSTEVGMRPAEPCSISVAATHQLLTNLFEYISVVILSDRRYSRVTGAVITEQDIKILERCNNMNIEALTEIVGVNVMGYPLDKTPKLLENLREAGDLWAEHVLENARAYIMSFIYIFATVISGFPLAYAIAYGAGLDPESPWVPVVKIIDAAIYFWLPQINITLLRLWQGRNLLHRMVGRTVVIGDIPWVAQSAEAFLSKIFAVSYSIAGLNVLSGNPADHFVHRHTHRVVRGTLAIFGRPDGRLSALSSAEASVCLSCNQASSIQSWGGTCESITVGHNPFKLDLSLNGIFLKRHRPLFLCERLLVEADASEERNSLKMDTSEEKRMSWRQSFRASFVGKNRFLLNMNASVYRVVDTSVSLRIHKHRSAPALLGAYLNFDEASTRKMNVPAEQQGEDVTVDEVVEEVIRSRQFNNRLEKLFRSMDTNLDGLLSRDEFVAGIIRLNPEISENEAIIMFHQADMDHSGLIDYNEFVELSRVTGVDSLLKAPPAHRDSRGIIQIEPSQEKYFGETMRKYNSGKDKNKDLDFVLAKSQHLCQELYETRIASMQRFVCMTVMFHHMGKRVKDFFSKISFGLWEYRMDRTHSIMRIATTASPVSGADVRQRMARLRLLKKVQNSVDVISSAYLAYKKRKNDKLDDSGPIFA